MARQAGFLALFSAVVLLTSEDARAQSASALNLQWNAPAACPQKLAVQQRIEKLVGAKRINENEISADGAITQTDDGRFHLQLVVRSGGLVGQRSIESKSCGQLASAAAVALGLLMRSGAPLSSDALGGSESANAAGNRDGSSGSSDGERAGDTDSSGAPTNVASDSDAASSSALETRRRWRARLQLPLLALGVGPLPRPSLGLALGGGVSFDEWGFFLQLAKWSQQHLPAEGFPGYGADADRLTAGLVACRAFRRAPFEIAPCVVMSFEHLSASGLGNRVAPRAQAVTWFAPGLGVQARVYLADWLSLTAQLNAQLEASRPQIAIDGVGGIAQTGPAAATVLVGPEWIL
ncbi:MAG: hypothetical protein ABW061_16995 [Polyangiaceae bacterium]